MSRGSVQRPQRHQGTVIPDSMFDGGQNRNGPGKYEAGFCQSARQVSGGYS